MSHNSKPVYMSTSERLAREAGPNSAESSTLGIPAHGIPALSIPETLSIPEVLSRIRYEKLTAPVPVKLYPSLAQYVKAKGGSAFIRTLILEKLASETTA